MSITIIKNQAINFRLLTEIEADICNCSYKPYCQKVNKFDAGKFQIISTNLITNGEFNGSNGWVTGDEITASAVITNETVADECDGSIVVTASGGTAPYTYSKDGTTFQGSSTFSDLCDGCYYIIVKDSVGNLGFVTGCIDTNVVCGSYTSPDLYDLRLVDLSKLINCDLFDLI